MKRPAKFAPCPSALSYVIPAKAGIQPFLAILDSGPGLLSPGVMFFRRNDNSF